MMNKKRIFQILLACLAMCSSAFAEDIYVQVKDTNLRATPQIIGRTVAELKYGDRLSSIGQNNGWVEVKSSSGVHGFVHISAVTSKRVVFSTTASRTSVDSDDVVLAGKGFSRAAEDGVKAHDPSLNFRAVDEMERSKVEAEELRAFIVSGKLNG